jgi:hypothetical protein
MTANNEVYSLTVDTSSVSSSNMIGSWSIGDGTSWNWNYCYNHGYGHCGCNSGTYYYNYTQPPVTVYKYQIICPKVKCGATNWLELDKITPCVKCKSKLKAVTEKIDFEIPVTP